MLQEGTSIICIYGLIRVSDARLRVTCDEYNRRASQEEEKRRLLKRDAHDEVRYLKRWLWAVRSRVRTSVKAVNIREIYSHQKRHWKSFLQWKKHTDWWSKTDRRLHLDSGEWLSQRYFLHCELHERNKLLPDWESAVPWPSYYDAEVIEEAVRFIVLEEKERWANRALLLNFETDGLR